MSPNNNSNRELGNEIQKLNIQNKRSFARIRQDLLRLKRHLAHRGEHQRPQTQHQD